MAIRKQKKNADGLNDRQARFVACYTGNVTEAAKIAGYKNPAGQARRLLDTPAVAKALQKKLDKELNPLIREKRHRLQWLVNQINDEKHHIKSRLKAYELLARSCGDFADVNILPATGENSAPPTIIVIKAGKESPVQVNFNQGHAGGEALPVIGEALPVAGAVSGDNWPEG